jgi:transcriptional regulator with XRE-family HTH domain
MRKLKAKTIDVPKTCLCAELKRKDIQHSELASILGISQSVVSRWCAGKNVPIPMFRMKIAEILEIAETELWEPK